MEIDKEEKKTAYVPGCSMGCQATWGLGNQLFIYASSGNKEQDTVAGIPPEGSYIFEVQWNVDMHSSVTRKLVSETHSIFMKLQKLVKESTEKINKAQMVKFSREYRSVIKACLIDLQKVINSGTTQDNERKELEAKLQLFDMIELVWSLCEILFIDAQPGGAVLSELLTWLRFHFVEGDKIARDVIKSDTPANHQHYWEVIYRFVLQGRVSEAGRLLSIHPLASADSFTSALELMRRMPLYATFSGQSLAEFDMRWRHWQEECVRRQEAGEFAANKNLETIVRILCGEDQVFQEVCDLCENWYCMLVSRLLYQNPTVKAFDLQYHTQFCINAYGGNSHLQPWDNILLAALEFDVHQVIKESSTSCGNWWFVSHLTDLLHHCGMLEVQTLYFGSNLREFLLLEYACSLISHPSLWQVSADYLDNCPQFGRAYLEEFVEKLPLESEKKTQKVLRLCEQRDMQDQVRSICKTMGMRALQNKRLGSALSWALRSKDVAFITNLAERFLAQYSENGDLSSLDLIDNLGSSMLLSSKLTFLGKYREFHKLYEESEFKAAATLLLSLLTARLAPKRFWLTLLTDALPLLEADDVIFSSQQTYELMHCFEELNIAQQLEAKAKDKTNRITQKQMVEDGGDQDKVELMKLALARNLARAIVQEGSTTLS